MQREDLISQGWQQFCIIQSNCHKDISVLAHYDYSKVLLEYDFLLVITQTCDLLKCDLDKEPYVEVIPLKILGTALPSGNNAHGKNPRRLEISVDFNGTINTCALEANKRFFVRHELLSEIKPFVHIHDAATVECLRYWIIARYNRAAFPDTFNNRVSGADLKKLIKLFNNLELITGIYLKLDPMDELPKDRNYYLEIILLMGHKNFSDPVIHQKYTAYCTDIQSIIKNFQGVDLDRVQLVSKSIITLNEYDEYKLWDYNYLSFRAPDLHETPI